MSELRQVQFFPDLGRNEPLWDGNAWDCDVRATIRPMSSDLAGGLYS